MAKKVAISHGDRVKWRDRIGTVVHVHAERLTVLPHDRSRNDGGETWMTNECELMAWTAGCGRCGARHHVFYCPEGI